MDRALYNYILGKQKEILATDKNLRPTSSNERKFSCIECGEYVSFVRRRGAVPYFRHAVKTDDSKDCEKRSKVTINQSLYEKSGLPLFIKLVFSDPKTYELLIGFPPLGQELLDELANLNSRVIISAGNTRSKSDSVVAVNRLNFFSESFTYRKLIIEPKEKISIELNPLSSNNRVCKRWANFIDEFSEYGAIFSFSDSGGRRVQPLSSISVNRDYFWVTKKLSIPYFVGLETEQAGIINLNSAIYNVFKFRYNSKIVSEKDFAIFAQFCQEKFKIHLLELTPEIVPLWPPATIKGEEYSLLSNCPTISLSVKSGNNETKAYLHRENEIVEKPVVYLNDGKYLELERVDKVFEITIDRKVGGNYQTFNCDFPVDKKYVPRLNFLDHLGNNHIINPGLSKFATKPSSVKSNFKIALYRKRKNSGFSKYIINDDSAHELNDIRNEDTIIFCRILKNGLIKFAEYHFHEQTITPAKSINIDLIELSNLLIKKEATVPTPPWIYKYLMQNKKSLKILGTNRILSLNFIPIGALKYLVARRKELSDGRD